MSTSTKQSTVVIVSAVRTPIGSFRKALSGLTAPELGATAIKEALKSVDLDASLVDEVFMGQVVSSNSGQAPARQAAILAGISNHVPCTTINKVCSSGMKSIMLATQSILLGDTEICVAGGMESMSQIPHYIPMRNPVAFGDASLVDGLLKDGLKDAFDKQPMGVFADQCADHYQISRQEQDDFAIASYQKAKKAWQEGKMQSQIASVSVPQRKSDPIIVDTDEEFTNVSFDKIPKLRAAFTKEGTVTPANASTINDGAAALLLMTEDKARELGLKPLAYIKSYADAAQEPQWFTTAPSKAIPKALKKAEISIDQVDLFELNEAFSVVGIANQKILKIPSEKLNIYGGAVALGHPLGCSGARILVTLVHALLQEKRKIGVAGICNGGGGASAMVIELVD